MDYEKEISFGAFDSELMHQEIYIPEGFEATIDGNKIILTRIENEDERIRKELIEHVKDQQSSFISAPDCRDKYEEEENNKYNSWLSWLEKQGEQKSTDDDMKEALRTEYEKGRADAFAQMQKSWSEEDDDELLSITTHFDVKEVDLDSDIRTYLTNHFNIYEDDVLQSKKSGLPLSTYDIIKVAEHFFELGMVVNNKAQKGE